MKDLIEFIKTNLNQTVIDISLSKSSLVGTRLFFTSEEGATLLCLKGEEVRSSLPPEKAYILRDYLISQLV